MYVCMYVCVLAVDVDGWTLWQWTLWSGWMDWSSKVSIWCFVYCIVLCIVLCGFLASPASPNGGGVVVFSVVVVLLVDCFGWSIGQLFFVLVCLSSSCWFIVQVVLCGVWFSHTLG